jgi:hypothetical protein
LCCRISIRDRKQKSASETDRQFLEAEYDRLDRECRKVSEEIKTIEIPESPENVFENGDDLTDSEINSTTSHAKVVKLKECNSSLQTNTDNKVNEFHQTNDVECDSKDTSDPEKVTDDQETYEAYTDTGNAGNTEASINTELDSKCVVHDSKSRDNSSQKTNMEITNDVNIVQTDNIAEHTDIVKPHSGDKPEL